MLAATFALSLGAQPAPAPPAPPLPYPHPLITEVLYAVPTGEQGDASGDGTRDTTGDEFVELVNPHDRPIQLRGYTLAGKAPPRDRKGFKQLSFTFPALELPPGAVVVVFNGRAQRWTGPVGDTARAPEAGHDRFNGAHVFTMSGSGSRAGFVNKGDCLTLTSPAGERLHCIAWGDHSPPDGYTLVEVPPRAAAQSLQRRAGAGPLAPHPPLNGRAFSPGQWPPPAPPTAPPAESPARSPAP